MIFIEYLGVLKKSLCPKMIVGIPAFRYNMVLLMGISDDQRSIVMLDAVELIQLSTRHTVLQKGIDIVQT